MTRRDWYCEDVLRPRETGSVLAPTSPHPALRRTFSALVRVPIGRIDARARAARLARDVLHSSVAQGLRALVVVVGISTGSGCAKRQAPQGKSEEASAARSAKDLKALTSAATGQWRAPWGRLSFESDGTAAISLRVDCAAQKDSPDPVAPSDGCQSHDSDATGTLVVEPYRLLLQTGDTANVYDAFVDADGKLHVDVLLAERVVPVDARRRGKIQLGAFKTILIEDTCSLVDELSGAQTIPCRFEQKGNLMLFQFQVPEGTHVHHKTTSRSMVYLEREQLLVPPSIQRMVFERVTQ